MSQAEGHIHVSSPYMCFKIQMYLCVLAVLQFEIIALEIK